jgi:hypothetical protein
MVDWKGCFTRDRRQSRVDRQSQQSLFNVRRLDAERKAYMRFHESEEQCQIDKLQVKLDLQRAGRMVVLSGHNIGEILKTQRHVNARNEVGYVR